MVSPCTISKGKGGQAYTEDREFKLSEIRSINSTQNMFSKSQTPSIFVNILMFAYGIFNTSLLTPF